MRNAGRVFFLNVDYCSKRMTVQITLRNGRGRSVNINESTLKQQVKSKHESAGNNTSGTTGDVSTVHVIENELEAL